MIKTVDIVGTEVKVEDLGGQNAAVKNLGSGSIYVSTKPNITAGADNVIEIPAGAGEVVLDARGTVYIVGTGKVQCTGTPYAVPNFKLPSTSSGGGGGTSDVTKEYVDAQDTTNLNLAKAYTDNAKSELQTTIDTVNDTLNTHIADQVKHITAEERAAWDTAFDTIDDVQDLQKQIADLEAYVGYTSDDIYGVEVDFVNKKFTRLAGAVNRTPGEGFNSIECFGGRKRCNVTDEGKVIAYYGDAAFTTGGKLTQAVTIEKGNNAGTYAVGTVVQVMVEQPKFYYKVVPLLVEKNAKGTKMRKARYYVSPIPKAGFKLHPAFIENGKTNDYIYLSAFEGSLWDTSASAYILDDAQVADFNADMLSSIAGAKPASGLTQNLTRANTRKLAEKRGAGWEQAYTATIAASQILMLIEYASFDMQKAIGIGVTNKTNDGSTSKTEYTGGTVSLGNASGAVTNENGYVIVSYRGEENVWGNIWTWVDGMNEQNPSTFAAGDFGTLFVADHGFADDTAASPYQDTGIYPAYGSGFISAFGYSEDFDYLFIPVEYAGNSSLPVGDLNFNKMSGWRVTGLGGKWSDGYNAGAFGWFLDQSSRSRNRAVNGRLVYVPSKAEA